MELGAYCPSFLILSDYRKEKKHGLIRHSKGLVISSNLGPSSCDLALMVLTTLLGSAFGLVDLGTSIRR